MKPKTPIRLMIVDDHPAFRKGLNALIQSEAGMAVVAEAGDGSTAIELYHQVRPDVLLIDLRMPGIGGVEAIMTIRKQFPDARIIVLTTYDADEDIYRAIQSGAASYLLKDMGDDQILGTIRAVHAGERRMPAFVAGRLAERLKRESLSQREMEVLELLVKGRSNKEIADTLCLTEAAVKFRLKGLFIKLDARDRTEAVVNALRHGIIHLEQNTKVAGAFLVAVEQKFQAGRLLITSPYLALLAATITPNGDKAYRLWREVAIRC